MLTKSKTSAGAARQRTAQTIGNFQQRTARRICFMCKDTSSGSCIYIERIGLCAACLNARIWRDEQTRFADFINSREANR